MKYNKIRSRYKHRYEFSENLMIQEIPPHDAELIFDETLRYKIGNNNIPWKDLAYTCDSSLPVNNEEDPNDDPIYSLGTFWVNNTTKNVFVFTSIPPITWNEIVFSNDVFEEFKLKIDKKEGFQLSENDYTNEAVLDVSRIKNKLDRSESGVSFVPLEEEKIPAIFIPSHVIDIFEYDNVDSFPLIGTEGKLYVDITNKKVYRWSLDTYQLLLNALYLGETEDHAFPGDRGKILESKYNELKDVSKINSIDTQHISNLGASNVNVLDGSVSTFKIKDLNVDTENFNNNSVTESKIINNSVSTRSIQDLAITEEKIENDSVITTKIKNLNVTTEKIADKAITLNKIADQVLQWKNIKQTAGNELCFINKGV